MPASYFELVLRHLGTTTGVAARLLAGTGVTRARLTEADAEITLGQQLRQLRNANRTFAPGWALGVGRALHAATHGPVGFAAVSAPALGAALEVLTRFCHVRNPSYHARTRQDGGEVRLEIEECSALLDEERVPLLETFLLSFQGIIEAVLGRPMAEGRFEIAAPAPSWAEQYGEYFHAAVRFAAPVTAIVIPAAWSALRCPCADRMMYAAALGKCEGLVRRRDGHDLTAARVEQAMVTSDDPSLPLASVARALGVSRRTLIRRLQGAGTSYRALSETHRRRCAEELLREGSLTAAEIAYRLGYEDPANFGRACRRWFGTSPGSLRRTRARGAARTGTLGQRLLSRAARVTGTGRGAHG